jgi:hypothetical protein
MFGVQHLGATPKDPARHRGCFHAQRGGQPATTYYYQEFIFDAGRAAADAHGGRQREGKVAAGLLVRPFTHRIGALAPWLALCAGVPADPG